MPNVMGQEFPYTPEGMAAAEQYRQTLGMRDGGMMGFRPVGYAGGINPLVATGMGRRYAEETTGDRVGSIGNALQRGVSAAMGAPVDLVNAGLGAVGLDATTPVGGGESISNAIDTVSSLVQQFIAQGIPEPVKNAVNAAIGTYGIPVDLVNSALRAIGVPVSDNPIGGSKNLKETFGMRDGGMMGFRPIGMQEGGLADATAIVQGLYDLMGSGTTSDVLDYMSLHLMSLVKSAKRDDRFFNTLRNMLQRFPAETLTPAAPMDRPRSERFGAADDLGRLSNRDLRDAQLGMERMEQGQPDVTTPLGGGRYPPPYRGREDMHVFPPFSDLVDRTPMPLPEGWENMPAFRLPEEEIRPMPDPRTEWPDDVVETANGGYITRDRNRGGLMSLRRR